MPGDCTNASDILDPAAHNGDGDSLIGGSFDGVKFVPLDASGAYSGTERAYAVDDLARAGLISDQSYDAGDLSIAVGPLLPKLKSGGSFMVMAEMGIHSFGGLHITGAHTYRLGV